MGIFVKNNHGTDYLYALAGKSQFFLGRKNEKDNLNLQNLRKAAKITDQNFDRILEKYLENMIEYSAYMPQTEGIEYLSRRYSEIFAKLRMLKK